MSFLQPILATQVGTTTVGSLLAQSVPYIVGTVAMTQAYGQMALGDAEAKYHRTKHLTGNKQALLEAVKEKRICVKQLEHNLRCIHLQALM